MALRTIPLLALLPLLCSSFAFAQPAFAQPAHCVPTSERFGVALHADRGESIVVWTESSVHTSHDGGTTWNDWSVPGGVATAALGRLGSTFVVSEAQLLTFTRGGASRRRALPFAGANGLVVHHGFAMYAETPSGEEVLATSADGRRWQTRTTDYEYHRYLSIDERGAIDELAVEMNTCGSSDRLQYVERRIGRPEAGFRRGRYSIVGAGWATHFQPGAHGHVYAFDPLGGHIVVSRPGGLEQVGAAFPARSGARLLAGHNRRITLAVFGDRLLRLEGSRRRTLDTSVPEGADQVLVDARGRALVHTSERTRSGLHSRLLRFERGRGWRELVRSCPATPLARFPPSEPAR